MRLVVLVALLLSLAAGAARAADVSMVVRDVSLHAAKRSLAGVPARFDMVGAALAGRRDVALPRANAGGSLGTLASRRTPTSPGPQRRDRLRWRLGEPEWTGAATRSSSGFAGR